MANEPHIPYIDLKAQYKQVKRPVNKAIKRVLDSQKFILGKEVYSLEKELARRLNCEYIRAISSGTDALLLSLMAIGIEPGDEVITTPYTFFSTVSAILRMKAKPVFVDINPETYLIDVEKIESAITDKTRAIIPVHFAGQSADMSPIMRMSKMYGMWVIEDACQAIGAMYEGVPVGTMGDIGCFSFYPTKNLGAYGDGGLVATHHEGLATLLYSMRNHGRSSEDTYKYLGGNFRMDEIQAAILSAKLPYHNMWEIQRRVNAASYEACFNEAGIRVTYSEFAREGRGVCTPRVDFRNYHVYNLYIIRVKKRDKLRDYLFNRNIETRIYYSTPLHMQPCVIDATHRHPILKDSEMAALETMALPVYPELSFKDIQRIVGLIADFIKKEK